MVALATALLWVAVARHPRVGLAVGAAGLGLELLMLGALRYSTALITSFQAVAAADPTEKAAILVAALDAAAGAFELWIVAAVRCLVIAAVIGAVAAAERATAEESEIRVELAGRSDTVRLRFDGH